MSLERVLHLVLGTLASPPRRDERGLSQSTENVILLVGAVTIAGIVIALVTAWVNGHLQLRTP